MIHVALVSAYPDEAEARAAFAPEVDAPYLGVWIMPTRERPEVHVFSEDLDADELPRAGWERP